MSRQYYTVSEIARNLNLSKSGVRRYLDDDFRRTHVRIDRAGVLLIDHAGVQDIRERMRITTQVCIDDAMHTEASVQTDTCAQESSASNDCMQEQETEKTAQDAQGVQTHTTEIPLSISEQLIDMLRAQLDAKDKQIAAMQHTIDTITHALDTAQALHAGTIKSTLPEAEDNPPEPGKKGLFRRLRHRK